MKGCVIFRAQYAQMFKPYNLSRGLEKNSIWDCGMPLLRYFNVFPSRLNFFGQKRRNIWLSNLIFSANIIIKDNSLVKFKIIIHLLQK